MEIDRPSPRAYAALALLGTTPQLIILLSPLILGWSVRELGLTTAAAGLLIAIEFAGLTVIAFASAPLARLFDRRWLAALGVCLAVAMQGATALADTPALVFAARFFSGIGIGLSGSIAVMCLSAVPRPSIAVAILSVAVILQGTLAFVLEVPLRAWSSDAIFGLVAISAVLGLAFVRWLPGCAATVGGGVTLRSGAGLLLAAYGLWIMSNATVWSFVERVGVTMGFPDYQINTALGIATLTVFIGIGIYFVASKRNEALLLIAAHLLLALSYHFMVNAVSFAFFAVGLCICTAAAAVGNIVFLDLLARLDRSGRLGAMSAGICAVTTAAGPVIGSLSIRQGGYEVIAIAGILQLAAALAALLAGGFVTASRIRAAGGMLEQAPVQP